jgi:hypothetical protein
MAGIFPCPDVEQLQEGSPGQLDIEGQQFGGVRALYRLPDVESQNRKGERKLYDQWLCECVLCGNRIPVSGNNLRRDKPQKSCGCKLNPGHKYYKIPGSLF